MTAGIDAVILLIILGMAYALMSEGFWGAVLAFFNILFAGLIAFNFYEPLATMLTRQAGDLLGFNDLICLMVPYTVVLFALRMTTDSIAPTTVRVPTPIYHLGRIAFALAAANLLVGQVLTMLDVAPVHKKVFGTISYARKPPFGLGVDHQWLGVLQYTTGQAFSRYASEKDDVYGNVRVFDPEGRWLIDEQNARPFGLDTVPAPAKASQ